MKHSSHSPGAKIKRNFDGYTGYQECLWQALDDFYFADVGGYGHTRMPTPGKIIGPTLSHQLEFSGWKELVIERWSKESVRDRATKGLDAHEISDNLWYYLYERFLDAEPYFADHQKEPKNTVYLGGC